MAALSLIKDPKVQRANEIRDRILETVLIKPTNKFKNDTRGKLIRCRYNKDGYIILNEHESGVSTVEMFCLGSDNNLQLCPYVINDLDDLTANFDPLTKLALYYHYLELFTIYDTCCDAYAYPFLRVPLRNSPRPKIHAMYALGYLIGHYNDWDFWLKLDQYTYFDLQDDVPQFIKKQNWLTRLCNLTKRSPKTNVLVNASKNANEIKVSTNATKVTININIKS